MNRSQTRRLALVLVGTLSAARAYAQQSAVDTTGHNALFTRNDLALAGAFTALTVFLFPSDRNIATRSQDSLLRANRLLDRPATGVELITAPGAYIIGGSLFALGIASHSRNLRDIGWHGTEAVILSTTITGILKGTLGRARPYVTADTNPRDFQLFRGFGKGPFGKDFGSGDYQSFPSGHTTTAFAVAAAVTGEMHRMHSSSIWYVAPALYGGATLVGLSRMYHNRHWTSDVIIGAAIGTFGGLKVVRYTDAHPDNALDRFVLRLTISPQSSGGANVFGLALAPAPGR
jgi:membrane-associated phospholipid phosphatase